MKGDHGDRFLNEFTEFIQQPVPMIPPKPSDWPSAIVASLTICNFPMTDDK